jgi:hypothetical protein
MRLRLVNALFCIFRKDITGGCGEAAVHAKVAKGAIETTQHRLVMSAKHTLPGL